MADTGRPPKYSTIEEIEAAINKYFMACDNDEKPYTACGLALALDFESRSSLYDYASGKHEKTSKFSYTVKKALLKIENYAEEHLYSNHSTGAIFALKNRGWTDKQELEHSSKDDKPLRFEIVNADTDK